MNSRDLVSLDEPLPRWKRCVDVAGGLLALPVLGLATMVAAVVTKLASPGPLFFRQECVGRLGRRFHVYKFRTMHVCADVSVHQAHSSRVMQLKVPMLKLDSRDSRLIPGAWWWRASGWDVLPQI